MLLVAHAVSIFGAGGCAAKTGDEGSFSSLADHIDARGLVRRLIWACGFEVCLQMILRIMRIYVHREGTSRWETCFL